MWGIPARDGPAPGAWGFAGKGENFKYIAIKPGKNYNFYIEERYQCLPPGG